MFTKPQDYSKEYYNFQNYNTKHRMLTYWHQISAVLSCKPKSVLEIGVGSGLVSSYLRSLGIAVTTVDINSQLNPTYLGSVLKLDELLEEKKYDVVLCARVLHHLPYASFSKAIENIYKVSNKSAIVTLPVEDFRFYILSRITSSKIHTMSIPLPLFVKRNIIKVLENKSNKEKYISGLWKLNGKGGPSIKETTTEVEKLWSITSAYKIPEDSAHFLMKLNKNE